MSPLCKAFSVAALFHCFRQRSAAQRHYLIPGMAIIQNQLQYAACFFTSQWLYGNANELDVPKSGVSNAVGAVQTTFNFNPPALSEAHAKNRCAANT
jgi:hypothetical protein